MTEARHDHAVSLLTAASPTIALLLERESGDPVPPSPPPQSPLPPTTATSTVVTATHTEPGPLRLAPSLLAAALEGPYPVEVKPKLSSYPSHVHTAPSWQEGRCLSHSLSLTICSSTVVSVPRPPCSS